MATRQRFDAPSSKQHGGILCQEKKDSTDSEWGQTDEDEPDEAGRSAGCMVSCSAEDKLPVHMCEADFATSRCRSFTMPRRTVI